MRFSTETFPKNLIQDIRAVSDFIYTHPELGYQEEQAVLRITDFLKQYGFEVEHPLCGIPTAFRAKLRIGAGPDTPCVCVLAEYDALPEMGHACGHHLITAAALSAACLVAKEAQAGKLPLNLCVMGTPAEEGGGGGKIRLIQGGAFDGIDMALMAHPGGFTETDNGALGVAHARITFHGKSAHATLPKAGKNALDAAVLFYADIMDWKQRIPERECVHGILTKTGEAANIIPDLAEAFFYVRAPSVEGLANLKTHLEHSAGKGAAATGCTFHIDWESEYRPIRINLPLNLRYRLHWQKLGKEIPLNQGMESRASTDMGNVTAVIPGAQFHFSICGEQECPCHSLAFRDAGGTEEAFDSAIKTGSVMAKILLDYATDPDYRKEVRNAFHQSGTSICQKKI